MNNPPISLDGGNVIIETIDGTQIGAFKSILAMHSTYFKTTFAQNDQSVLKMEEDISDWRILLEAMLHRVKNTPLTFHRLRVLLKMSRKYGFDKIIKVSENQLSILFPQDLKAFDRRYTAHLRNLEGPFLDYSNEPLDSCDCGELACSSYALVTLINYAVEWKVTAPLPIMLYLACARLSLADILKGVCDHQSQATILLCPAARDAVILGREKIRAQLWADWYPLITEEEGAYIHDGIVADNCTNSGYPDCHDVEQDGLQMHFLVMSAFPDSTRIYAHALNPIPWDDIMSKDTDNDNRSGLCENCQAFAATSYEDSRCFMFNSLEEYFSLA